MAKEITGSVSSANKIEGLLGVGLIIALVGFFLIMIFQGFDNLFQDILDSIGNFPGLKQVLALFGTIATAFTKIISFFFSGSGSASSSSGN